MKFFKEVSHYEVLPRLYGVCYRDFARRVDVACPIPFNWLVAWARDLYFFLVVPKPGFAHKVWQNEYATVSRVMTDQAAEEIASSFLRMVKTQDCSEQEKALVIKGLMWCVARHSDRDKLCARLGMPRDSLTPSQHLSEALQKASASQQASSPVQEEPASRQPLH